MRPPPLRPRPLWCAPDVHAAAVGADLVFLDVGRDHYHCLPGAAAVLRLHADGRMDPLDGMTGALAPLLEAGLACRDAPAAPRASLCAPARELPPGAPSRGDVVRAGLALLSGTAAFRGKTLAALIAAGPRPDPHAVPDETRLARWVSAARLARPWIPFEGECLQRAFLLRRLLAEQGLRVDWVFGVRTWPFGAHCWLQSGDLVIGDRLERVGRYTPLLRT